MSYLVLGFKQGHHFVRYKVVPNNMPNYRGNVHVKLMQFWFNFNASTVHAKQLFTNVSLIYIDLIMLHHLGHKLQDDTVQTHKQHALTYIRANPQSTI